MTLGQLRRELRHSADPERAAHSARFFKTGPGEYGEGDRFLGVKVPELRRLVRRFRGLPIPAVRTLLKSPIHEERLLALLILVLRFSGGDAGTRGQIVKLYLKHTRWVNSWDLVDGSAHRILGAYLADRDRAVLYELARSASLWERRIAIISTYFFVKRNQFADTLRISEMLLGDKEDLIHKATGWMLREVGKRDRAAEEEFLRQHYERLPRTALRYAIEHFPESARRRYLKGEF
jgi:3-methyladenine DNA glycosylase AlkD